MQGITKELLLRKVAPGDGTILILGSTGTGKSHLAQQIHRASSRRSKPFVSVNLGTLNENLFESELFGHEKGAFSGAHQKRVGKFEAAQGGTIFLDEIGELSLGMQTRLLDCIYSKRMTPVGSNRELDLDVRILAATNRDLAKMVKEGKFREDLYFRINIFSTSLPDISQDFTRLQYWINFFLKEMSNQFHQDFLLDDSAKQKLISHNWPGNLRELKNSIEYAATMCEGNKISAEDLPIYKSEISSATRKNDIVSFPIAFHQAKAEFEEQFLTTMLSRFSGTINQTARETQISKVTLIDKIRRYGIDIEKIKYEKYLNSASN